MIKLLYLILAVSFILISFSNYAQTTAGASDGHVSLLFDPVSIETTAQNWFEDVNFRK